MSNSLGERVRSLERLVQMLGSLGEELSYNQAPIPAALHSLLNGADGAARCFLDSVIAHMGSGLTPPEAWRTAALSLGGIDRGDRAELATLSAALGGSHIEGQRAAIDSCIRALQGRLRGATEIRDQRARIYRTLGVLTGAAVVVCII